MHCQIPFELRKVQREGVCSGEDLREFRLTSHVIGTSDMPFVAHPHDLPHFPDADGSLRENGVAMVLKREEEGVWAKVRQYFLAPTAQVFCLCGARLVLPLALRNEWNVAHAQRCGARTAEEDLDCLSRDRESFVRRVLSQGTSLHRAGNARCQAPSAGQLNDLCRRVRPGPAVAWVEAALDLAKPPVSEVAPRAGAAADPAAGASSRSSSPSSIMSSVSCRPSSSAAGCAEVSSAAGAAAWPLGIE